MENRDIAYVVIESLIGILTLIGNSIIIFLFIKEKALKTRTYYYVVSLAIADFFVGLTTPLSILVRLIFFSVFRVEIYFNSEIYL
jgi:adenosine receptor A3